jgi:lysozyme
VTRTVPACAIALLKRFEGLHDGDKRTPNILEPMPDPVGLYTVGWGFCLFEKGRPVRDKALAYEIWRKRWPGGMTREQADQLLIETAQGVCDKLLRLLPGVDLNDNELGALVSLAYNIGLGEVGTKGGFASSTVRKMILAGQRWDAANAFRSWRFAAGRVLQGLVNRREAERELFLTPAGS